MKAAPELDKRWSLIVPLRCAVSETREGGGGVENARTTFSIPFSLDAERRERSPSPHARI